MRQSILALLLLVPAVASASGDRCEFHADRNLDLDLAGVHQVRFTTGSYELTVAGNASGARGSLQGKACASDQETLDTLVVTQRKDGDVLTVTLGSESRHWGRNSQYSDLKVSASLPAGVPVRVDVGSGSATVRNVASLESSVGSGELQGGDIKGAVRTKVASGSAHLENVGPLTVDSVASGEVRVRQVGGDATLGSVASGSLQLSGVSGSVNAQGVASGSLAVREVKGSLSVGRKGSGDVSYSGIGGKVDVPQDR
ncbi:MAG: hypothetical protein GAK28_04142 [Luteibacter sp.]|uniref:DUF4097 family beta strand repeat-containing protein n=1 Tax=Luteibacter sp. TaxID=1886636 RepID=UPI001385688F|nr:DUF4097 family beta strand repeat-containing protein [Luteibacter sp.]KAF1004281.1 MAG: hypothetical protein GAK28_04142 [Luteibacter sp.]